MLSLKNKSGFLICIFLLVISFSLANASETVFHPQFESMQLKLDEEFFFQNSGDTGITARDRWFSEDKFMHFIMSAGVCIWSFQVLHFQKDKEYSEARDISISLTFTLGLSKEILDFTGKNKHFSWKDLLWDTAGITAAYFLYIKQQE